MLSIYCGISLKAANYNCPTISKFSKYVGSLYCRAEMYAGRVACCPLVIHGEHADGTGDRQTEGETDRRHTITLSFPLYAASVVSTEHR